MFFQVDSTNRHAVRKVLTNMGMPSSEVRNLRNGQLGKAIYMPGMPIPGVYCNYIYTGKIPCTGPRRCRLCGEVQP